jgi:hypothetical protein
MHWANQNKGRGMLTCDVVLLADNMFPNATARNPALLERSTWELFDQPPYNPGLASR